MKAAPHTLAAALVLALLATLATPALAVQDGHQRQHTTERPERNPERTSQREGKRTKPAQEQPQPCPRRFRKPQDNWLSRAGHWLRERFKSEDAPPQRQHQSKGEQVARRER